MPTATHYLQANNPEWYGGVYILHRGFPAQIGLSYDPVNYSHRILWETNTYIYTYSSYNSLSKWKRDILISVLILFSSIFHVRAYSMTRFVTQNYLWNMQAFIKTVGGLGLWSRQQSWELNNELQQRGAIVKEVKNTMCPRVLQQKIEKQYT